MKKYLAFLVLTRFGIREQILFSKRLALYLRSGIPISRAITFIIEDSSSPSTTHILKEIEHSISAGLPLSQALAQFPKCFSSFTTGFISTGEASGTLAETLDRLATVLSKRASLTRKILSALAYPLLVLCGTIAVALFLTLFIFPKIIPVLKGFHTTLPLSTRLLIGIDQIFAHDWLVILIICALVVGGMVMGLRKPKVQLFFERGLLLMPLFSQLYQYYAVSTFTRTLSIQLKGGVRIMSALVLVRTAMPGKLYPEALHLLEAQLSEGQRLSAILRQQSRLFPPLVCQMVAAGETTGTLSANLESLADTYEESLDELAKNLTVLVEPLLMVCMGFVVGFVALAIITPIYQVTQNLTVQ
jgi:type II secretory pathway component PulF